MLDANQYYKGLVDSDFKKSVKSARKYYDNMKASTAWSHGYLVHTLYMPKLFDEGMEAYFESIAKVTYGILDKVIGEYMKNPEYRGLFGFDKRLEELILRPVPYKCTIPITRIDLFFNEETYSFKFCEFNTDGASAMNEDREMNRCIRTTDAYKKFTKKFSVKTFELFKSWAREFLKIYKSCENAVKKPHIGIVDFLDGHTNTEFEEFKKAFNKLSCTCDIYDIRELEFKDGRLIGNDNKPIDAIYRRAVTCDIMRNYDEVQGFIDAVKANAVCLIGDFRTQIAHDKIIFKILHDDMTLKFLTPKEQSFIKKHIPFTVDLTRQTAEDNDVFEQKDNWVIKPHDSYASKGVYAGVEFDNKADWKKAVEKALSEHYILQRYCPPYENINIDLLYDEKAEYLSYSNITGLFLYGGKFAGIYSRIAKNSIISTQYSEMSLPSMVIKEKN